MTNSVSVSHPLSTITPEQLCSIVKLTNQVFVTDPRVLQTAKEKVIQLLAVTPLLQPQLTALLSRLHEFQVHFTDPILSRINEIADDALDQTIKDFYSRIDHALNRLPELCSREFDKVPSELSHLIALDMQVKEIQEVQDLKLRESSLRKVEKQVSEMVIKSVWKPFAEHFISINQHISRFKDRWAMLDAQKIKLNCYGLRQLIHTLMEDIPKEQHEKLKKHFYEHYVQECEKKDRSQGLYNGLKNLRGLFGTVTPSFQKESTMTQAAFEAKSVTNRKIASAILSEAIEKDSQESAIRCILENPTQFGSHWDFDEQIDKVTSVGMLDILMDAGLSIETINRKGFLEMTLNRFVLHRHYSKKEREELAKLAQALLKIGVNPNAPHDMTSWLPTPGCYESRLIFAFMRTEVPQIFESWLPKLITAGLDVNSLELVATAKEAAVRTPLMHACAINCAEKYRFIRALIFNGAIVTTLTEETSKVCRVTDQLQRCVAIYRGVSNDLTIVRVQRLAEILPFSSDLLNTLHSYFDIVAEIRRMCYEIEQKDTSHALPSLDDV